MVKPEQGAKLKATLAALLQREDIKAEVRSLWTTGTTAIPQTETTTETPAGTPAAPQHPEGVPIAKNDPATTNKPAADKPWWDVL
jgi:hypothetical protein